MLFAGQRIDASARAAKVVEANGAAIKFKLASVMHPSADELSATDYVTVTVLRSFKIVERTGWCVRCRPGSSTWTGIRPVLQVSLRVSGCASARSRAVPRGRQFQILATVLYSTPGI